MENKNCYDAILLVQLLHMTKYDNKVLPNVRNKAIVVKLSGEIFVSSEMFFSFLKGSLTRDFRLQVFFIYQCPPGL